MNKAGVFIVSGAGSGIGQSIARLLAENGQRVFGIGRTRKKLENSAEDRPRHQFGYAEADLSDPAATLDALRIFREWREDSPLLGLVNNAGFVHSQSFLETPDEIWEKAFHGNVLSAVRLTRELYGDLRASGSSSVVNISSVVALRPVPNLAPYAATKAALINWTRALALEWAADKIRINCICPGIVDTPAQAFHASPESLERRQADMAHPLKTVGEPRQIAEAAWFLLSDRSNWTTGAVLSVDGGLVL